MKPIQIFIINTFLIATFSCTDEKSKENNTIFYLNPDDAKEINISHWINQIALIPLETTTNSLLANCYKILEYDNHYYIHDFEQNAIFKFDIKGKFVFSTKHLIGRGPKEYASMVDFDINPFTGKLEILDALKKQIKILELDGNYNGTVTLPEELLPLSNFKILTEDIYIFYSKGGRKIKESILFYSMNQKKVLKRTGILPENINFLPTTTKVPFYELQDNIYFSYTFPSNNVYKVNKERLSIDKTQEINFGKYNFSFEELPTNEKKEYYRTFISNNTDSYAFILSRKENRASIFIHFYFRNKTYIAKINKQSGKTEINYNTTNSKGQLPPPHLINDNALYYVCEPGYLDYVLDKNLLTEESKFLLSKISINDNPVLIKYTLN
jgi:hypothetical protein